MIIKFIGIFGLILLIFLLILFIVLCKEVKFIIVGIFVKFCKIILEGLNGILFLLFVFLNLFNVLIWLFVIIKLFFCCNIDFNNMWIEYGNLEILVSFFFFNVCKL